MTRAKRRKGRVRPLTVARGCRWLRYVGRAAVCELKLWSRLYIKAQGGLYLQIAHKSVSCNKCRGCGYEEDASGETMVSKLGKRLSRNNGRGGKDKDVRTEPK